MNTSDIITIARTEVLRDTVTTYSWSDDTLLTYLISAEKEACRRSYLIFDKETPSDSIGKSLCSISVVAGASSYFISNKILKICDVILTSTKLPLYHTTTTWLDEFYTDWKIAEGLPAYYFYDNNKLTVVPKPEDSDTLELEIYRLPLVDVNLVGHTVIGSSNITFTASTNRISMATGDFKNKGFKMGQKITISGTTNNNGTFNMVEVYPTYIVVYESLTTESNTSAVLFTDSTPEINEEYHLGLIDWVCHLAYLKHDSQTLDPTKSKDHLQLFELKFGSYVSASIERKRKYYPTNMRLRPKEMGY